MYARSTNSTPFQPAFSTATIETAEPELDMQNTRWNPATISSLVFGIFMAVLALVGLWQAYRHRNPHQLLRRSRADVV
ncbi:hypothetical protein BJY00DRAFT_285408 [Aspergillus carlsbadensis]|nr:hypothetical protein BJY00DRAFT_285408 [Aspergillus carlsbadensis]